MMRQKATKSALIRWQRQWSLWRFQQPTMLSRKENYEGRHKIAHTFTCCPNNCQSYATVETRGTTRIIGDVYRYIYRRYTDCQSCIWGFEPSHQRSLPVGTHAVDMASGCDESLLAVKWLVRRRAPRTSLSCSVLAERFCLFPTSTLY